MRRLLLLGIFLQGLSVAAVQGQENPPGVPSDLPSLESPGIHDPVSDPGWSDDSALRLDGIRGEVRALITLQRVLEWYTSTAGEETMLSDTYRGHESLFSRETLNFLAQAQVRKGGVPEDQRALASLQAYVAAGYLQMRTAPFRDRVANAERAASVRLSWLKEPVGYREIDRLLVKETDPGRRAELQDSLVRVWTTRLNPLLAEEEAMLRGLAVDAGYPSYLALAESYRGVGLDGLVKEGAAFLKESNSLYLPLLETQSQLILKKPARSLTRADLRIMTGPSALDRYFEPGGELPALNRFLSGIGLNLRTLSGSTIQINSEAGPHKAPEPRSVAVRVPRDVRLSASPLGGNRNYGAVFFEAAQALMAANTATGVYEFQQLGSEALPLAFGEFFRAVWDDPSWLKRYFGTDEKHERLPGGAPRPNNAELAQLIRHRVFWNLFYIRRVAYARVLYELIQHGAAPARYQPYYSGSTSDLQGVYRKLFSEAYGFDLSPSDALRFRTDSDELALSADQARGYMLAHRLHEVMQTRFGEDWYGNPEAGRYLRSMWANGRRMSVEEVAISLGDKGLSLDAALRRMKKLLEQADALEASSRPHR